VETIHRDALGHINQHSSMHGQGSSEEGQAPAQEGPTKAAYWQQGGVTSAVRVTRWHSVSKHCNMDMCTKLSSDKSR
jgi:hypothetical protein